jgi:hypothetical protein
VCGKKMAMLEKVYECLNSNCKAQIKLEKRADGGWNKFNLDGSPHTHHPRKGGGGGGQRQQQPPEKNFEEENRLVAIDENRLINLEKEVNSLKAYIKTLITQVQLMRQELEKGGGGEL